MEKIFGCHAHAFSVWVARYPTIAPKIAFEYGWATFVAALRATCAATLAFGIGRYLARKVLNNERRTMKNAKRSMTLLATDRLAKKTPEGRKETVLATN